jgi:hypothetical protein
VVAPHGSRGPSVIEVAVSIALPVRRHRHAAWGGWVCRSTEQPLSAFPTIVEFVAAPVAILFGATFFAGAVQILGDDWVSGREPLVAGSRAEIWKNAPR